MKQLLKEHGIHLAIIAALAILAMAPFLQPNVSQHSGDWRLIHQTTPIIMKEAMMEHHTLPLWTRYIESGIPFLAIPDKPFTYLPLLALLAILNPYNALNWGLVLNLIFAGFAMYALAFYLTKNKESSLVAALLWSVGRYMLAEPPSWLFAAAWVPLVFLFTIKAIREKHWLTWSVLSAISLSMMVHAGGVFQFFVTGLFLAPLFLFEMFKQRPTFGKIAKLALVGVIIIGFFFGLSAIRLLPYQEWVGFTNRETDLPIEQTSKGHLTLGTIIPQLVKGDGPSQAGIIGTIFLLLSIAEYRRTKDKNIILLWIFVVGILIIASAIFHGFFYNYVPGFSKQRGLIRNLFVFSFAAALLGAYGYQYVVSKIRRPIAPKVMIIAMAILGMLIYADTLASGYEYPDLEPAEKIINDNPIINFVAQQPGYFRMHQYEIRGIDYNDVQALTIPLGIETLYGHYGGLWMPFFVNEYLSVGLQDPAKIWGMLNVRYLTSSQELNLSGFIFVKKFDEDPTAFPDFADGPYLYENSLVLPRAFSAKEAILVVGEDDAAKQAVYWMILQGAFNSSSSIVVQGRQSITSYSAEELSRYNVILLVQGSLDGTAPVQLRKWVESGGILLPDVTAGKQEISQDEVRDALRRSGKLIQEQNIVEYRQNSVEVEAPGKAFLVMSEKYAWLDQWNQGWTARAAEGTELPILKADGGISAVWVPEDTTVTFRYRPRPYVLGKFITFITIVLAGALIWYDRKYL